MEWVGFLALIALGGYMVFASIAMQLASMGFSGKSSLGAAVILAIGSGLIFLAWANKPFAIVVT